MSKGNKAFVAQVGVLLAFGSASSAVMAGDGFYLGLSGGATFPKSQNFKIDFANETATAQDGKIARVKLDDGWIGGVAAGYAMESGLRPELAIDRRRNDVDSITLTGAAAPEAGVFGREITNSAIGNLWFDLFKGSFIHPYIGGGAGVAQLSLRDAGYGSTSFLSKHDEVFVYQYGGGITIDIGYNFSISADYRHVRTDSGKLDLFEGSADPSRVKFRYEADEAMLSLRYYFGAKPEPVHEDVAVAEEPVSVVEPIAAPEAPAEEPAPVVAEAAPATCEAPMAGQRISLEGCKVGDTLVLRGVTFEFNKATLTPDAKSILDEVADELRVRSDIKVEVDGHTDSRGSDQYNLRLSESRADAVKVYLIGRGIDSSRLSSHGFGESQPVADNATDEGRELNRRVELKVVDAGAPAAPAAEAAPVEAAPSEEPAAEAAPAE